MSTTFTVGDLIVHRVIESEGPLFDPLTFFPTLTQEVLTDNLAWLRPVCIDPTSGKLVLCIQSYVVRTQHHTILIDSCVGNHKERTNYPFWHQMTSNHYERSLAAVDVRVNDIDYVMCTHMHVDHVGWNTRLENGQWVPTFPKA
jgi:predicted metal-dependent RNase